MLITYLLMMHSQISYHLTCSPSTPTKCSIEFEKELKENSPATPTPLISEQPTFTLGNLSNNSLFMRRRKKMLQNKSKQP